MYLNYRYNTFQPVSFVGFKPSAQNRSAYDLVSICYDPGLDEYVILSIRAPDLPAVRLRCQSEDFGLVDGVVISDD